MCGHDLRLLSKAQQGKTPPGAVFCPLSLPCRGWGGGYPLLVLGESVEEASS